MMSTTKYTLWAALASALLVATSAQTCDLCGSLNDNFCPTPTCPSACKVSNPYILGGKCRSCTGVNNCYKPGFSVPGAGTCITAPPLVSLGLDGNKKEANGALFCSPYVCPLGSFMTSLTVSVGCWTDYIKEFTCSDGSTIFVGIGPDIPQYYHTFSFPSGTSYAAVGGKPCGNPTSNFLLKFAKSDAFPTGPDAVTFNCNACSVTLKEGNCKAGTKAVGIQVVSGFQQASAFDVICG